MTWTVISKVLIALFRSLLHTFALCLLSQTLCRLRSISSIDNSLRARSALRLLPGFHINISGNVDTPDSAGGPASPKSMAASGAPKIDGQYVRAILKGEIKVTKLNSDNYQSWADGTEIFLDATMLSRLGSGTETIPEPETKPVDNKAWRFDDAQAKPGYMWTSRMRNTTT